MHSLRAVRKRLREIYGESCENTVTKTDMREAAQLKADAEKGVVLALPYAKFLARQLDIPETNVEIGPMKTLARMFEKAIGKCDGQLDEINDVGRLRIPVDGPEDILTLRRMFGTEHRYGKFTPLHPNNSVTVTGIQDYYWEPSKTGRIAYHVDLDVAISGSKSVGIEIQFVDKRMLGTEKATHLNYQKVTGIERAAKRNGRDLRADELETIEHYRESSRNMYLADAQNYGYDELRRPDLRAAPHLRLAVA